MSFLWVRRLDVVSTNPQVGGDSGSWWKAQPHYLQQIDQCMWEVGMLARGRWGHAPGSGRQTKWRDKGFIGVKDFVAVVLLFQEFGFYESLVLLCFVVLGWNSGFCDVFVGRGLWEGLKHHDIIYHHPHQAPPLIMTQGKEITDVRSKRLPACSFPWQDEKSKL